MILTTEWTPDQETRLAIATLIGAMVHALDKANPGTASAFKEALERRYADVRESNFPVSYLEALQWARDAVTVLDKQDHG